MTGPVKARYFVDLPEQPPPGAFTYYTNAKSGVDKAGMIYTCPCGCGDQGSLAFRQFAGQRDIAKNRTWEWDGNVESPTLIPSINHVNHWHGHLKKGIFTDA